MTALTMLVTASELERIPQHDAHVELVKGEIITMPPAGFEHGGIAAHITFRISEVVFQQKLGRVYAAETGFILSRDPDTVRAPDAAFVSNERLALQVRRYGFFDAAPDLAVEVASPDDTANDIQEKVIEYLEAGTRLVWIVQPRTRTITVYRSLKDIRVLRADETLDGADVLPGFSMIVSECFQ